MVWRQARRLVDPAHSRPDPDALLERVQREDRAATRGKLKIFFGAAPGVGKTYAMLEAARSRQASGIEVLVGVVETHGRADTAAQLEGLDVLPRRELLYKGQTLTEFDLDAALARHPQLLLLDELAHTNAEGSRHRKRWQDVAELLDSGIDVYSTLNVQHIESLNDVVAQITGVLVRETVPDHVLDLAHELELIDLPADELIDRLRQGKVYLPEQAERALEHFFQPGNLNALRELALRRTAESVDSSVLALREESPDAKTWPVNERILVAIGPSPFAPNLIRATRRLATQLEAEWFAVYVETAKAAHNSPQDRETIFESMKLAESLGAEVTSISGDSVATALLNFARSRNISRIVVGKAPGSRLVNALIQGSGEISVIALDGGIKHKPVTSRSLTLPPKRELLEAALVIAVATGVSLFLRDRIDRANLVMVFLLAVLGVSVRSSRSTATIASFLAVASFDFFCVPPYLTFAISDSEYLLTFAVMLTLSLVVSSLTVRLRQQAGFAIQRENRTHSLYQLSRNLSNVQRIFEAAETLISLASQVFQARVNIYLPDTEGKLSFRRRVLESVMPPSQEEGIAQWAFDHRQRAGKSANTLPGATFLYIPLVVQNESSAVFAIETPPDSPEQTALLEAMLNLTAQTIERLTALDQARQASIDAEAERLRGTLLSAVSHDLKTPLASITGAASTLASQDHQLSPEQRTALSRSIEEESQRLNRLVTNLLEMTRLESAPIALKKDWCSLEELIASTLESYSHQLEDRQVQIHIAPDAPLVSADELLLEHVLSNLLENALHYTPPASPLEFRVTFDNASIRCALLDSGPGLAPADLPHVFDKFYRGALSPSSRGAGLGLAIVKAIIEAHHGTVSAANRIPQGAIFEFTLPLTRA